jgi:AraC-like DNA-binding protein
MLYVGPESGLAGAPGIPRMLRVSPLLHEFVLRVVAMPIEYDENGQDRQIVNALLGEIDWTPIHPVSLQSHRDERLRLMEQSLLNHPGDAGTLEQWAAKLDISPRTLTRLLRRETNLTLQTWRDQIRTFVAIPMLTEKDHWSRSRMRLVTTLPGPLPRCSNESQERLPVNMQQQSDRIGFSAGR